MSTRPNPPCNPVACWRATADDGGKQARSPGRARRKPLKPLRGECRAFSGVTVVTNARAFYTTRAAGRIGRPAFPAPSDFRGERYMYNSGVSRREIANAYVEWAV